MLESKPYVFDPGRILPEEERAEVVKTITPILQIKSKACKRESNNDRYRLGRR